MGGAIVQMKVRSPLIWFGGKGKVAHHIIKHFPPHKCYVEPFGGAAHVLVRKEPVKCEVYNDIDGDVVNFLLVARNEPERLRQACSSLPYSRELYNKWRKEELPEDPFERAVRYFYLNRSAIAKGNKNPFSTGWRHGKDHNTARSYQLACQAIEAFAERMKNVMIDQRDFRDIIRVYDGPNTLFYVDPPYVGREKQYKGGFSEKDHHDLAEMLNNIKGKAVVSYYEHPLIDELYPSSHWRRVKFRAARQVVNGKNDSVEEMLLMNFPEDKQSEMF